MCTSILILRRIKIEWDRLAEGYELYLLSFCGSWPGYVAQRTRTKGYLPLQKEDTPLFALGEHHPAE